MNGFQFGVSPRVLKVSSCGELNVADFFPYFLPHDFTVNINGKISRHFEKR
jgi:hypothetical protein